MFLVVLNSLNSGARNYLHRDGWFRTRRCGALWFSKHADAVERARMEQAKLGRSVLIDVEAVQ